MTDLSHRATVAAPARKVRTGRRPWPLLPYVGVVAAGATGLVLGRAMGGDAGAFEDKLLLLLRFMAVLKVFGVLTAAVAAHWRFGHPIAARRAFAYVGAIALMGLAPGLIWSLGGIAQGAVLFHAGLLGFLYLAWTDDAARPPQRR